jgi:hypothetical protein
VWGGQIVRPYCYYDLRVVRNRVFLREYFVTACSNGKNPVSWVYGWPEIRVVRNRVFGENTWLQLAATAKTRFLWFGFFGFDG